MENRQIIIMLLIIIVVLLAAIGFMLFNHSTAKQQSIVKITSEAKQSEGGVLSVKLTGLNDNPISKEIISIKITDNTGKVVVDDVVKTDSKGKAELDLNLEKGEYSVNVTYGGNENYTSNGTAQKLTITQEVVKTEIAESDTSEVPSQSSEREEDQVTPDGWDPKEHEVSREKLDDGYERVNYDDGYMRVVDKDGNIVSYGY